METLQYISAFFSAGLILFCIIYRFIYPYHITEEDLKRLGEED